jgi:hypothetical protein
MIKQYIPKVLKALEEASAIIMEVYARDFDIEIKQINLQLRKQTKHPMIY